MAGSQIATLGQNETDPAKLAFVIRELSRRLSLVSEFALTLLDDETQAAMQTTLGLLIPTNVRRKLTASLTINVPADYATIQLAYDYATGSLDFGGQTVTIQVAAGTYTGGLIASQPWTGGGSLVIQGDIATPTNVVWSTTSADNVKVTCVLPGLLTVQGFKHQTTTSGSALRHEGGGTLQYGACNFGACATHHVFSRYAGANIAAISAYTISGGAGGSHFIANNNSAVSSSVPVAVTLSGTPAFATFIICGNGGIALANFFSFSGAATGMRYSANGNSVIFVNGQGPNWFPGSIAGNEGTGGRYI